MIVGIIAAKDTSKRFPGKNKHEYKGHPLFWHSVIPLLESKKVDAVYVATNSDLIKQYCEERGVGVIWRPPNASHDEEHLLQVLRYAYKSIDKKYDFIMSIMANCPGHSVEAVDKMADMVATGEFRDIRSYNEKGEESGMMIYDEDIILNAPLVSTYVGAVWSDIKEIHYKEDLDE